MELSKDERAALKQSRNTLKLSLRDASNLVAKCDPGLESPNASTISRWEKEGNVRDVGLYERLKRIYNEEIHAQKRHHRNPADMEPSRPDAHLHGGRDTRRAETPAPLKFGLRGYPDSAIFATVVEGLFGGDAICSVETSQIQSKLAGGELDLAIFNRTTDLPTARIAPRDRGGLLEARTLMRLRGNALLAAAGEGWETFNQLFSTTKQRPCPRDLRQREAMGRLVKEFLKRKVSATDFYMPAGSSRWESVLELLAIGRTSGVLTRSELEQLDKLVASLREAVSKSQTSGVASFNEFLDALARPTEDVFRHNALFPAGLTQRISSEEAGATPLIDCDDLQSLAALDPMRLMDIFFPRNVLVITHRALETKKQSIARLRSAWNELVTSLREMNPPVMAALNTGVDRWMAQTETGPDSTPRRWAQGTKLIENVVREQLLELIYWVP